MGPDRVSVGRRAGPTHVGMDRSSPHTTCKRSCRPHARGDGPRMPRRGLLHARRPHARGDGPPSDMAVTWTSQQAPRTWGWTETKSESLMTSGAGPTHVGMDRQGRSAGWRRCGRPHARGDGPFEAYGVPVVVVQAPRTWGWTARLTSREQWDPAGPTHVGMDRSPPGLGESRSRRPHARGDGPVPLQGNRLVVEQAPRTWGWTELIDRPDILEAYERRQAAKN